ncbi:MAG: hypothetical protein ACKVE3_08660, partial [Dissulfuribacterales bacterium]
QQFQDHQSGRPQDGRGPDNFDSKGMSFSRGSSGDISILKMSGLNRKHWSFYFGIDGHLSVRLCRKIY